MRQAGPLGMGNHLGIRATTLYDTADESMTISSCPGFPWQARGIPAMHQRYRSDAPGDQGNPVRCFFSTLTAGT